MIERLVHSANQLVDLLLMLTAAATLLEVSELLAEATLGGGQLDGPQEVGGLLEVGTAGEDLVHEILHAHNIVLAQTLLDDGVVGQGHSLAVQLAEASLVDEVSDRLKVRVAVGNVGLHQAKHLQGGGVDLHEDAIVHLAQSEQLQDLLHLGGDADDTAHTDHKDNLLLSGHEDLVLQAGGSAVSNGGGSGL